MSILLISSSLYLNWEPFDSVTSCLSRSAVRSMSGVAARVWTGGCLPGWNSYPIYPQRTRVRSLHLTARLSCSNSETHQLILFVVDTSHGVLDLRFLMNDIDLMTYVISHGNFLYFWKAPALHIMAHIESIGRTSFIE